MAVEVDEAEVIAQDLSSAVGQPVAIDDPKFGEIITRFQETVFKVPDRDESDGFLFQYGPVNWFPEPTFTVGVVRQLEVEDEAGEHEAYVQVNFEFRYDLDDNLKSFGSASDWWFPGEGPFEAWLRSVIPTSLAQGLHGRSPREFAIWQETA